MTLIAEGAIKEIAPTVKRLHMKDIKAYSKLNEVPAIAIHGRTFEELCTTLIDTVRRRVANRCFVAYSPPSEFE